MVVVELNKDNFDKEVRVSKIPVLVDFYANWCDPCKRMKPVFEELSEEKEFHGKLKFAKISAEDNEDITSLYMVQGIPALLLMKDGQEVERIVGFYFKDVLRGKILEIMKEL